MDYYQFVNLVIYYSNLKSEYNKTWNNGRYDLKKEGRIKREMAKVFDKICDISSKVDWESVNTKIK